MDRTKISFSYESDRRIEPENTEREMEDSKILGQELDALNENQGPCTELAPNTKYVLGRRKEYPDKHLEADIGENLHKRKFQVRSKLNRQKCANGTPHRSSIKSNNSSVRKINNIRRMGLKYLKRAIRNPTGTKNNSRLIRRKGKKLKIFKSNCTETLTEDGNYISEMDTYKEIFEDDFWLEIMSKTKEQSFDDLESRVINTGKPETEDNMLSNIETQSNDSMSNYTTLPSCSTQSTSASLTQYDDVSKPKASEDIFGKKVLEHFRLFMQSKEESFDRTNTDDINQKDVKLSPESEIRSLEDPTKKPTESVNQDLEDSENSAEFACQDTEDSEKSAEFACQDAEDPVERASKSASKDLKIITTTAIESKLTQNLGKLINETSVIHPNNCANGTKYSRNNRRQ